VMLHLGIGGAEGNLEMKSRGIKKQSLEFPAFYIKTSKR
jgi:hypothetical protein